MTISTDRLISILRAECSRAGSQSAWATSHDISEAYVSDVLKGRREPGRMIARALRYTKISVYQKIPEPDR